MSKVDEKELSLWRASLEPTPDQFMRELAADELFHYKSGNATADFINAIKDRWRSKQIPEEPQSSPPGNPIDGVIPALRAGKPKPKPATAETARQEAHPPQEQTETPSDSSPKEPWSAAAYLRRKAEREANETPEQKAQRKADNLQKAREALSRQQAALGHLARLAVFGNPEYQKAIQEMGLYFSKKAKEDAVNANNLLQVVNRLVSHVNSAEMQRSMENIRRLAGLAATNIPAPPTFSVQPKKATKRSVQRPSPREQDKTLRELVQELSNEVANLMAEVRKQAARKGELDSVTPVELGPASSEVREDGHSDKEVADSLHRRITPRNPPPPPSDPSSTESGGSKKLRPRWFNRFKIFRWLCKHPRSSGGGGVVIALLIAKQALDYELTGAVKTAAFVFFLAWGAFALGMYISSWWDRRKPVVMVAQIVGAVILFGIWWAYLPPPPAASIAHNNQSNNPISPLDSEALKLPIPKLEEPPEFLTSIDYIYVGGADPKHPKRILVLVVATIKNLGGASAISSYWLTITLPNRSVPVFILNPAKLPDEFRIIGGKGEPDYVFYANESLPDKTLQQPISKTAPMRGVVAFVIEGQASAEELLAPGVTFHLMFKDVQYRQYQRDFTLGYRPPPSDKPSFVGLKSGPVPKIRRSRRK